MQYFTFLGLGDIKDGYTELLYKFGDNLNLSKFIQEIIIEHYQNEINGIFVFVTKESRERYSVEFFEMTKKYGFDEKNIKFIDIDYSISFDGFVEKMLENLVENIEFIIDITHSFRNIPMKLLFSLDYIEKTKKSKLIHLFYGLKKNDEGEIFDFIDDYKLQGLSMLLQHFDQTLKVSLLDYNDYISQDINIKNLTTAIEKFNEVIEFCEFDQSLEAIRRISESTRCLLKRGNDYTLIIPILREIQSKLNAVENEKNNVYKKIEFIMLLLNHGLYQIAITFTDQFFREELIRRVLAPTDYNFNINEYLRKNKETYQLSDNFIYNFSQILKNDYIKNSNYKVKVSDRMQCDNLISENQANLDIILRNSATMKNSIINFDNEIRNKINHGKSISITAKQMKEIINKVLNEIRGGVK